MSVFTFAEIVQPIAAGSMSSSSGLKATDTPVRNQRDDPGYSEYHSIDPLLRRRKAATSSCESEGRDALMNIPTAYPDTCGQALLMATPLADSRRQENLDR